MTRQQMSIPWIGARFSFSTTYALLLVGIILQKGQRENTKRETFDLAASRIIAPRSSKMQIYIPPRYIFWVYKKNLAVAAPSTYYYYALIKDPKLN